MNSGITADGRVDERDGGGVVEDADENQPKELVEEEESEACVSGTRRVHSQHIHEIRLVSNTVGPRISWFGSISIR